MPKPIPGSTAVENILFQRFYIQLKHLPSGDDIFFKAMLTQFEDQYTSDWTTEALFGRMDPVRTFRGTQRIITLGWDVVAASLDEAKHNFENCSTFLRMLYPSYDGASIGAQQRPPNLVASATSNTADNAAVTGNTNTVLSSQGTQLTTTQHAATIQSAPLFRLKFANLIQSAAAAGGPNVSIESGLIGSIDGLTYSPDVEQGFFDPGDDSILYPQTIKLSFGFMVSHDHPLGYGPDRKFRTPGTFPYPKGSI